MRRIAVFVEGQTEQLFVRHLLSKVPPAGSVSFECYDLKASKMTKAPYPFGPPGAQTHFLIVNVGNDETVLSAIKEREKSLFSKGYDKIVALRDMYGEEYRKRARKIDPSITKAFIQGTAATVNSMSDPARVRAHFSIMEVEAWFLVMHELPSRLCSKLTPAVVKQKLGCDLSKVDPETCFFKPSDALDSIFSLMGKKYTKSRDVVERICSHITRDDYVSASASGKCASFKRFHDELLN